MFNKQRPGSWIQICCSKKEFLLQVRILTNQTNLDFLIVLKLKNFNTTNIFKTNWNVGQKGMLLTTSMFNISFQAITDEQRAEIQSKFVEVGKECLSDNPLTAEDIIAFRDKIFPDGDNAGCFAACVFRNVGIVSILNHYIMDGKSSQIYYTCHIKLYFN